MPNDKERTWSFTVSRGPGTEINEELTEKELQATHIQLMTGELIRMFEDMPSAVQYKFYQYVNKTTET